MPGNALANEFLKACGVPVAAPSANISGRPSPTTWKAVFDDLNGRIDCILQGEATAIGLESTVVDCTQDAPVLLRPGAVSLAALRDIVASTRMHEPATGDEIARSPGLKHKHYAPNARVVVTANRQQRTCSKTASQCVYWFGRTAREIRVRRDLQFHGGICSRAVRVFSRVRQTRNADDILRVSR